MTSPSGGERAVPQKPLLRGWSHAVATVVAIGVTIALARATSDDLPRLASMLVFGICSTLLFGISATYHLSPADWHHRRRLRALDHANIFLLIAGTFTPICFNVLYGPMRSTILTAIWVLAVLGISVSLRDASTPRWLRSTLYVGMGWTGVIPTFMLFERLPPEPIALIVGGGLVYSIGAIIYARRWPDPFPTVFGFHEVFHLLVIAGFALYLAVIWWWVVPFARG
ncbi:MAG: hemolysin III family protein [Chloroflexota bacterium]